MKARAKKPLILFGTTSPSILLQITLSALFVILFSDVLYADKEPDSKLVLKEADDRLQAEEGKCEFGSPIKRSQIKYDISDFQGIKWDTSFDDVKKAVQYDIEDGRKGLYVKTSVFGYYAMTVYYFENEKLAAGGYEFENLSPGDAEKIRKALCDRLELAPQGDHRNTDSYEGYVWYGHQGQIMMVALEPLGKAEILCLKMTKEPDPCIIED